MCYRGKTPEESGLGKGVLAVLTFLHLIAKVRFYSPSVTFEELGFQEPLSSGVFYQPPLPATSNSVTFLINSIPKP